jgi:hypothetical protein
MRAGEDKKDEKQSGLHDFNIPILNMWSSFKCILRRFCSKKKLIAGLNRILC